VSHRPTKLQNAMVFPLNHYYGAVVPSPSSPLALGLRPARPDDCVVPCTPAGAPQPHAALNAPNFTASDTPWTADKGSKNDDDPDAASAGPLRSPASLACDLFSSPRRDSFYSFCGDIGLLDSEVRYAGPVSQRGAAEREEGHKTDRIVLSFPRSAAPSRPRTRACKRQSPRCVTTRARRACGGGGVTHERVVRTCLAQRQLEPHLELSAPVATCDA
jgi:hypothetical protein